MTRRIAITGARGFIGSRFVELYGNQPELSLQFLSSASTGHLFSNYALDDYPSIAKALKNVDVMIHCAFDHSYKANIAGMKNILKACEVNNVQRLVYLSTVSVYDPFTEGTLTETSPYSIFNDPYSREKRAIEQIIDCFDATFEVAILQPAIVYGLGGNWTESLFNASLHARIALPEGGQCRCNAVYVDDVAMAIYRACNQAFPDKKVKCLISGGEPVTWLDLYGQHSQLLDELSELRTQRLEIIPTTEKTFHENTAVNFIFTLWFETFLWRVFNPAITILRKLRSRQHALKSSSDVHRMIRKKLIDTTLSPSWMTRLSHRSKFFIDISKAKSFLDFNPTYSLAKGIDALRERLRQQAGNA